jgi:hypothetical protein
MRLARQPPATPPVDDATRYAFLWDKRRFEEQCRRSWLLPHIKRLLAGQSGAGLDPTTMLATLSLEERSREILGLVDLAHSHYYSNREVIAQIARFIARGELPPAA